MQLIQIQKYLAVKYQNFAKPIQKCELTAKYDGVISVLDLQ